VGGGEREETDRQTVRVKRLKEQTNKNSEYVCIVMRVTRFADQFKNILLPAMEEPTVIDRPQSPM